MTKTKTSMQFKDVCVVVSSGAEDEIQALYLDGKRVKLDPACPSMAAILKAVGISPRVVALSDDADAFHLPENLAEVPVIPES